MDNPIPVLGGFFALLIGLGVIAVLALLVAIRQPARRTPAMIVAGTSTTALVVVYWLLIWT